MGQRSMARYQGGLRQLHGFVGTTQQGGHPSPQALRDSPDVSSSTRFSRRTWCGAKQSLNALPSHPMNNRIAACLAASCIFSNAFAGDPTPATASAYQPKRVNKAIELIESA